jgi:hypothetical protein
MGKFELTLLHFFFSIFFLESFNSSGGVQKLLFPGEERVAVRANLNMDLLFRALRLEGSSTGTLNHRIKNLWVNVFFHLHSLRLSILPIFHKFSTFLKNSDGVRNSAAPSLSLALSPLLIHGVEEIPIALGGLHFVQ